MATMAGCQAVGENSRVFCNTSRARRKYAASADSGPFGGQQQMRTTRSGHYPPTVQPAKALLHVEAELQIWGRSWPLNWSDVVCCAGLVLLRSLRRCRRPSDSAHGRPRAWATGTSEMLRSGLRSACFSPADGVRVSTPECRHFVAVSSDIPDGGDELAEKHYPVVSTDVVNAGRA